MSHSSGIKKYLRAGVLFTSMLCFALLFKEKSCIADVNKSEEMHTAALENRLNNALLGNSTVTVPAASVTVLNVSFSGGCYNKFVKQGTFATSTAATSFLNFFFKETLLTVLHNMQLHLVFCVLRI